LLGWVAYLSETVAKTGDASADVESLMRGSLSVLVKTADDQIPARETFSVWWRRKRK
jgi:hypothetical protein